METEVRYFPIDPNQVAAAKNLCEKLNDHGTPERQLLEKVMALDGATGCAFGAVKLGGKPRIRITVQAPNAQLALVNFKSNNDPDPVKLRDLLNKVLETPLQDEPCPVALTS